MVQNTAFNSKSMDLLYIKMFTLLDLLLIQMVVPQVHHQRPFTMTEQVKPSTESTKFSRELISTLPLPALSLQFHTLEAKLLIKIFSPTLFLLNIFKPMIPTLDVVSQAAQPTLVSIQPLLLLLASIATLKLDFSIILTTEPAHAFQVSILTQQKHSNAMPVQPFTAQFATP